MILAPFALGEVPMTPRSGTSNQPKQTWLAQGQLDEPNAQNTTQGEGMNKLISITRVAMATKRRTGESFSSSTGG